VVPKYFINKELFYHYFSPWTPWFFWHFFCPSVTLYLVTMNLFSYLTIK
jgi:hypothetical protein